MLKDKGREIIHKISTYVVLLGMVVATYFGFIQILNFFPELSGVPYAITKALIGVGLLKVTDEALLYEVDTMQILKKDAKAYSIYILAYALIIALAIMGA
jgi:hypothetical protein